MNVLLIGAENKITGAIINKLNKSNHRIYWLTGEKRKRAAKAKHVFETYNFSCTDDNVKDIMESVRPDVVLLWELTTQVMTGSMTAGRKHCATQLLW